MKIAYFDCFAGASGDMILGALMDAGLGLDRLKQDIAKLGLSHYDLDVEKVTKHGIGGSQARVIIDQDHHHHHHRHLSHIRDIIAGSGLDVAVKDRAIRIFTRLAEAEAHVHGTGVEEVHFHEVGAMDAIIDVVGAVAGFHALGIEKIYASPLHVGSGTIQCAHGVLPVPAPATAELIKGKPVYSTGVAGELLTPTGAAILTTLADEFGPMPAMTVEAMGYGAGTSEPAIPNLLRVIIGESAEISLDLDAEQTALIETNIDDMNPQMYDYLIRKMLDLGALDVFLTPIQMKKNRPGVLLSVICVPADVRRFSEFLLTETTTIGLRWRIENRLKSRRTTRAIETSHGPIRLKVVESDGGIVNMTPEYDDCKRAALEQGLPLKRVMEEVRAEAFAELNR